jgi:hypothetical protein
LIKTSAFRETGNDGGHLIPFARPAAKIIAAVTVYGSRFGDNHGKKSVTKVQSSQLH